MLNSWSGGMLVLEIVQLVFEGVFVGSDDDRDGAVPPAVDGREAV
jgi:hypothetical protein